MVEAMANQYFSVSEATAIGDRTQQQDAKRVWFTRRKKVKDTPLAIAVVADGLGGHKQAGPPRRTGRDASQLAVDTFEKVVERLAETTTNTPGLINQAIREAGRAIYTTYNQGKLGRERIETTIAGAVIKRSPSSGEYVARYAAVGDTPVFYVEQGRNFRLQRLTTDEGIGNFISNAIGGDVETRITNTGEKTVSKGNAILIATDGVTNAMYRNGYHGLEEFLSYRNNWRSVTRRQNLLNPFSSRVLDANKLVAQATKVKGKGRSRDNATAVVVQVK